MLQGIRRIIFFQSKLLTASEVMEIFKNKQLPAMEFSAINIAVLYNASNTPIYSSFIPSLIRKCICAPLLWHNTRKTGLAGYFVEDKLKPELIFPPYSMGKPMVNIDAIVCTLLNAFLVYV